MIKQQEQIILGICIGWIIIDFFIGSTLFEWNHTLAKWLQGDLESISSPRFVVFIIITQFGYAHIVGALIIAGYVLFANKIQALKVVIYTLFSAYVLSLLKLLYHEPRPYFVYQDLHGIGCDTEFGKPSGHAMVTLVLYYLLFDSYINKKFFDFSNAIKYLSTINKDIELTEVLIVENEDQINENIQQKQQLIEDKFMSNKLYLALYGIIIFLIGLSRVVLGAHSFSQVILGWCYGTVLVILYRLNIDELLENVLLTITYKGFKNQKHFNQYVIYLTLGYAAIVIINIYAYNIVTEKITQEERLKYIENIRSKPYCNTFTPDNYKFLGDKCLTDTVSATFIFGILLTILYTKGQYNPQKWNESYIKVSYINKGLRIIIVGLVCLVPFLIIQFLHLNNIYLHYFFKSSLQAFLIGFALIKITPWAHRYVKMDVEGDYLQSHYA